MISWTLSKLKFFLFRRHFKKMKATETAWDKTFTIHIFNKVLLPRVCIYVCVCTWMGFPGGSVVKNLPAMQELQEMQVRSLGREDPLEEGVSIHSSILAWRMPWMEEPDRLQSIGSQRVGHNWSKLARTRVCVWASLVDQW